MNVALLQGQLAVVILIILVLLAIVAAVLFFGVFGEAVRRNPHRPGNEREEHREGEELGRDEDS